LCYAKVARDLDDETSTEMIAIPALAQIIAAYTPPSGKGHAETARLWVADQVAALRTYDAAQEAPESETQDEPAQDAKPVRRKAA
jgi:hypothetical protein